MGRLVTAWGWFVLCFAFPHLLRFKILSLGYVDSPSKPSQSQAEEGELILLGGEDVPKRQQPLLPGMRESRTQGQPGTGRAERRSCLSGEMDRDLKCLGLGLLSGAHQ